MTDFCNHCGAPDAINIGIIQEGVDTGVHGNLCAGCLDDALTEMERLREEFEALLAAGVSRDDANIVMMTRGEELQS